VNAPPSTRGAPDRPLHVCYVVQEWHPAQLNGIARLVDARASGLAARGHAVRVITRTAAERSVMCEEGVWVHRIPDRRHVRPASETVPQPLWDRSASVFGELMRIDAEHAIDVVDVPNWDVEGLATILDGRFMTVLGLYTSMASYVAVDGRFGVGDEVVRAVLDAERRCYQRASAWLAASPTIVEEVERAFDVTIPRERLGVIPHGLPPAKPPPEPTRHVRPTADRPLDVLFVGRLEARKGIGTLLQAIPRVVGEVPHVRFTIVGDDRITSPSGQTFREEFESSWAGARFGHLVEFTGIVDDEDLDRHYRACDLFVAPSLFESFGLVLLEAMRLGRPVVAGDTSGMREVIGEGTGVLVPPGDVAALSDAVVRLLRDPGRRAHIGLAGRRRFEARFSQQRMTGEIEHFYRMMLRCSSMRPSPD